MGKNDKDRETDDNIKKVLLPDWFTVKEKLTGHQLRPWGETAHGFNEKIEDWPPYVQNCAYLDRALECGIVEIEGDHNLLDFTFSQTNYAAALVVAALQAGYEIDPN